MTPLALYLAGAMQFWCPIGDHAFRERAAITEARYADIASTIADVASDLGEAPLFEGGDGRERTALLLASIASYESGCFRTDVQFCAPTGSGDGGHAWGIYQSHLSRARVCWSLRSATLVALEQVRKSVAACSREPWRYKLSLYASGSCASGHREARNRYERASIYWGEHPLDTGRASTS